MLDRHILPLQKRLLHRPAARLTRHGVTADALSLIGLFVGTAAALLITQQAYLAGLLGILINRGLDGLDGEVARQTRSTDRGAFIDIAFDFMFYALIPAAFALADPTANAVAAVILLVSFIGTGSSFLAFATVAAKRGITATTFPQKGIYYLGGLTEGAETILAFVLMCLWPAAFPVIAWLFAAFALLTTVIRWWWGWRLLSETSR